MAFASLLSGLALANARLGAVHGCAAVLGGLLRAPHGVLCARLLPALMEANVRGLERRAPGAPALTKYAEIGRLLTGHETGMAAAITWAQAACEDLAIPRLSACGLTPDLIPAVVAEAQRASSTKGNPVALTDEELAAALGEAM
jgi:alcohol dehydrogenase class IV